MNDRSLRITCAVGALIFSSVWLCATGEEPEWPIIPKPLSVTRSAGSFLIGDNTYIIAGPNAGKASSYLAQRLRKASGYAIPIRERESDDGLSTRIALRLGSPLRAARPFDPGREGYRLTVSRTRIDITAAYPAGLFYGVQTLLQLLPPQVYSNNAGALRMDELLLPLVEVTDRPRFGWRGLMIDVSRHFFSKEQLKKTIDAMAVHKLNVLHLHLTDDPGWRIEIEKYPRLTTVGAIGDRTNPEGPERWYFSKEDIREIVEHAARHHIMVVPEIDMPGHSMAAARAYPQFFDGHRTFNPANAETYEFVKDVLVEVMELFPSGYLHFGGDEVRDHRWADIPGIRTFMEENGYTDLKEVEGHFDRFVADFIVEKGYTPIGWDDIVEFEINPNTIVQWWLHLRPEARDHAVRKGHRVIISPTNYLYFDYPNGPGEPGAPWEGNDNGPNSFELIHQWEPVPDTYSQEEESRIMGLQANLWTEFVKTNEYYEYMIFPRLSALAEIAWSPKGAKDLDNFKKRLHVQCQRYEAMGLNYRVFGDWPSDFSYLTH